MQRSGFIPLVKRSWLILVLGTVIAGVSAYVVAKHATPTYEADASLLTGPLNADFDTLRASGTLARTYADIAKSRPLLEQTAAQEHLKVDIEKFRKRVVTNSNDVTRIVTIGVRESNPALAARLANGLARNLIQQTSSVGRHEIDQFLGSPEVQRLPPAARTSIGEAATRSFGSLSAGHLEVVEPATPPETAVSPRVKLLAVLGALAGLFAAALVVFLREHSRDSLEDEKSLATLDDVPFLGPVQAGARRFGRGDGLVIENDSSSRAADAYRLVAARMGFWGDGNAPRSLLVVGSEPGDGSASVAANLAALLAEGELRVTLVDADRSGEVTKTLGLNGQPGYGDLFERGAVRLQGEDIDRFRIERSSELSIVPAGRPGVDAGVRPERAKSMLDLLHAHGSDVVIVHAPPVDRSAGTLVWARLADRTLVVARRRGTSRERLTESIDVLRDVGANVAGTVLAGTQGARA